MAIYHLHIDSYRRSRGRTAIGGAAYRRGLKAACRTSGKRFNFRAKSEVVFSEFVPAQNDSTDYTKLSNLLQLYEAIECAEKHPRATLGREIEAALPHELTLPEQVALVRSFVAEVRQRFGAEQAFFDFSIHDKPNNTHAHICMSEREQVAPFVFGKTKRRDWDGEEFVRVCREIWQAQTNSALEKMGINQRVDCRSHADRGLRLLPSFHEGKAAYFSSEVKQMNDTIKQHNKQLQAANEEWQERKERAAKILRPHAFQVLPLCQYEMKCEDEWNPIDYTPNTRLFNEVQYHDAFPFSEPPSYINLRDYRKAVLHFSDRTRVVDYGDKVESIGAGADTAAERIIWLALAKGWGSISLSGDDAFLRAAFALALEHGIKILPRDEWQLNLLQEARTGKARTRAEVVGFPNTAEPPAQVSGIPSLADMGSKLKKAGSAAPAASSTTTKKRRHGR